METKFNFNSQVATTWEQSERLLALGIKFETADMMHQIQTRNHLGDEVERHGYYSFGTQVDYAPQGYAQYKSIPAWSLSRLLCMLTCVIPLSEELPAFYKHAFLRLHTVAVSYEYDDYDGEERILVGFNGNGLFAAVVDACEWLIKEGYFNKEYLV